MVKVLTVDLDWLLGDIQNTWSELDEGNPGGLTQNQFWQLISWKFNIPLKNIKASKWRIRFLSEYLYACCKMNKDTIVQVVDRHHQVYPVLNRMKDIKLTNIDHHHDILYRDCMQEEVDCGNWIYHLARQGKLISYHWYCNKESNKYEQKELFNISNHCPYYFRRLYKEDNPERFKERFDMIFIVKSSYYTPKKVQELANMFRDICIEGTVRAE